MKIKEYRLSKGLTQSQIANMLGMTQQSYNNKELGLRAFKPSELLKLEIILGATIRDFYEDELIRVKKELRL